MTPPPLLASRTHRNLHLSTLSGSPHHSLSTPSIFHWFPSGHLLATAPTHSTLLLHPDSFTSASRVALPSPHTPILALSISTDARYLAYGTSTGLVAILDLVSKHPVASFSLSGRVVNLAFHRAPHSRYLACATPSSVSLYSRLANRVVATYAVASPDRSASFGPRTAPRSRPSPTASVKITAVGFSPQHYNLLVATDESGCVNVWDISSSLPSRSRTESHLRESGESLAITSTYSRFTSAMRTPASGLSFAPAGGKLSLCVGGFDKMLRFFDPTLKRLLFSIGCPAPVSSVSFATDGLHLGVGMTNGFAAVWRLDADQGKGRVVTEICVDRAGDGEGEEGEVTAVRQLSFQPMDMYNTVGEGRAKGRAKIGMKPPPLAGFIEKSTAESRTLFEEDEEELDLDAVGLDVTADSKSEAPNGWGRSAGPRDSDLFSPVARRTPRKQSSYGAMTPSKASSFHGTPGSQRRAHITFRTPRARTTQSLASSKEETPVFVTPRDELHNAPAESQMTETVGLRGREVEIDHDSDSLDSIPDQSEPKASSSFSSRTDAHHLHGSTVSEDAGQSGREGNSTDRSALVSPNSGDGTASSSPPMGITGKAVNRRRTGGIAIPRSTSDAGLLRFKATGASPIGSSDYDVNKGSILEARKDTGEQRDRPSRRISGNLISDYQPTTFADGQVARGNVRSKEKISGVKGLAEELRLVIAQELDLVRFELRKDVMHIHSEMVVMAAKQSHDMEAALVDRDARVQQLEAEVKRLQKENEGLKRKFGLGL